MVENVPSTSYSFLVWSWYGLSVMTMASWPTIAPNNWAVTNAGTTDHDWRPQAANPIVTAGLMWAEIWWNIITGDDDADAVAARDRDPAGSESLAALEVYVRHRAISEYDQECRAEKFGNHFHEEGVLELSQNSPIEV